ncbi:ABC transporter, phosphonate, substrate-binding protein [Amphritea atlantica]|uniref:ABC transporter, phosphonate, substrate-binding protein n=1 Tax=Amphritea atlantica TaxID=355243 RepID=A0A1H9HYV4_9GAMM|nr:PhnD/SsuA/transferrin family substrate-binding protein [Amphritea atlantica]SEQ67498.1 ABC transporter, phosphonate, substrate-binding protein [Amphritea atlantica]
MDNIRLLTPPNDTARDSERWYEFAIYLSRQCGDTVTPLITTTAEEFQQQLCDAGMVYCAPEQIPSLIRDHRFIPLMQPVDVYEEVVIASGPAASEHRLSAIQGCSLGGIKGSFANRLGLTTLKQKQIQPGSMAYAENWLQLLKAVQQGQQPYALLSKNFIDQLSELSLTSVNLLARSHLRKAFPLLMVAPQLKPRINGLREILERMADDPKGAAVVEKLNNQGWKKPSQQSIINMVKLLRGK